MKSLWLYHETEARSGRLFHDLDDKDAGDLEADGWTDSPANFSDAQPNAPKEPAARVPAEKPVVPKAAKAPPAPAKPKAASKRADPASKPAPGPDAGSNGGNGTGRKPVADMSEDDLRAALEAADVKVPADATREQLAAGYSALMEG